jgi:hypothetical protein
LERFAGSLEKSDGEVDIEKSDAGDEEESPDKEEDILFLSRHALGSASPPPPNSLYLLPPVPPPPNHALVVNSLRMQVAQAMIGKTLTGRYRLQQQQQQEYQKEEEEELIPGATVCVQQLQPQEELSSWLTGCCALDALLTFFPYGGGDDDLIRTNTRIKPDIVLHLSGPYGKTQLALQLARSYASSSSQNDHRRRGVRYCYSTAGHAGLPHRHPTNTNSNAIIEFQPIRSTTQLVL